MNTCSCSNSKQMTLADARLQRARDAVVEVQTKQVDWGADELHCNRAQHLRRIESEPRLDAYLRHRFGELRGEDE